MAEVIVEVEQGKLRGKTDLDYKGGKFYSFHGIPYAKPPLADLRFKDPVAPEAWQGVREATVEPSECLSRHFLFYEKIVGSEDCLYLNVYTPKLPNNGKVPLKPVMFWIHGGAFIMGFNKREVYGPEILITEDVVLVATNYRLGVLGFLRLEDPSLAVPGNAGLKDILMALKWVQKNIENFGGDSNNVTIFGESAGAAAVHALVLSSMAKGLFHRAIMQSGCTLNPWVFGCEKATTLTKVLGNECNNEEDALKYLRSLPAANILEAQEKFLDDFHWDHVRPFGVVVEKNSTEPMFFSEHPLDIIKSGNYNKVPFLIGHTTNEGLFIEVHHKQIYGALQIQTDFETTIPYYLNIPKGTELSLQIANKIKEFYFGSSTPSIETAESFFNLSSDALCILGIHKTIKTHLKTLGCPIYYYMLSADTEVNLIKRLNNVTRPGVCHADDLGYLFKSALIPGCKENSIEELTTQRMVKLWTNFARNGNPNPVEKDSLINVTWKPVEEGQLNCLDIGTDLNCTVNPNSDNMTFWDEIAKLAKQ